MIFAFYGTLRKGQYNFDRFNLGQVGKYIGTHIVNGYKMMSYYNFYPKVYPGTPEDKIVVELHDIQDRQICNIIEAMERGAGYRPSTITVDGTEATIYVGDTPMPEEARQYLIPSGDWVEYDTKIKNARASTN